MKKYRFYLNDLSFIDFTEEKYNDLEDCDFSFNGLLLDGKIIKPENHSTHKYPIMIIAPKENFVVLDVVAEITAPAIEYKDGIWSEKQ